MRSTSYMWSGCYFLLTFSADIINNVQSLQSILLIIIGSSDLVLDGCHKSSCIWKEFANL